MIWFIVAGIMFIFGILLFSRKDDDGIVGGTLFILIGLVIVGVILCSLVKYSSIAEELKIGEIQINNKRIALEEMKMTYYKQPSSQINVDLVNKELSVSINKSISELADYINNYNKELSYLKAKKKLRFFVPCFVDISGLKPIEYKKEK